MNFAERQAARELEVFSRFVTLGALPFDLQTIQKRPDGEPDILCTHHDVGPIAFELTEICDPNLAEFYRSVKEDGRYYIRTSDPSDRILRKKVRKPYVSAYPIELLCFTDGRVLTPVKLIHLKIRLYMNSRKSLFRRAWLLSGNQVDEIWSSAEATEER